MITGVARNFDWEGPKDMVARKNNPGKARTGDLGAIGKGKLFFGAKIPVTECWGSGGQGPKPPEARGSGGRASSAGDFSTFRAN